MKNTHGIVAILIFIFCAAGRASAAAPDAPLPESYFCMHTHTEDGDYARAFEMPPFDVMRTWDSRIGWPSIQPEKNKWDWSLLDAFAELAKKHNKKLLLTLGMTPKWAAANPDAPTPYGGNWGSSPPRDIEDWKAFVRAAAERNETKYGGVIRYWEIWNEPDNTQGGYAFYTGTAGELADMGSAASGIIRAANPENKVLSPGVTQIGAAWLDTFFKKCGPGCVDIVTYHFYWDSFIAALPDFNATVDKVKAAMAANGLAGYPMWLTETGFGLGRYKTAPERRAALVSMMIAPWANGTDVTCAYSWNNGAFTQLYDMKEKKTTAVFDAYVELHKWLAGSVVSAPRPVRPKALMSELSRNGKRAVLVWCQTGGCKGKFNASSMPGVTVRTLDGKSFALPADALVDLADSPVLIGDEGF